MTSSSSRLGRLWVFLCLGLSIAGGSAQAGTFHAGGGTVIPSTAVPKELKAIGFDQNLNQSLPMDLPFRDESGKAVTLSALVGKKPAILVLAYYGCPRLCTLVLNNLAGSLGALTLKMGTDYNVITVSIDPRETPELASAKKASYLQLMGARANPSGWRFLTGTQASIAPLAKAAGFRYTYDAVSGEYGHAAGIMVLTPAGKLSHYFLGLDYPAKDLRLSLVEASHGRIGSPVDQLLLFCHNYDPTTGKYGLIISRVVNLVLCGIALALGLLILFLFKTDRLGKKTLAAARE